jgi:hypothetical protein
MRIGTSLLPFLILTPYKPPDIASPCSSDLPHLSLFLHSSFPLPSSPSAISQPFGFLAILASIGLGVSIAVLNAYLLRLAVRSLPSSDHGDSDAFCDCAHFLTWHRFRAHCWHLAATDHCTPCAARVEVYERAAICYR